MGCSRQNKTPKWNFVFFSCICMARIRLSNFFKQIDIIDLFFIYPKHVFGNHFAKIIEFSHTSKKQNIFSPSKTVFSSLQTVLQTMMATVLPRTMFWRWDKFGMFFSPNIFSHTKIVAWPKGLGVWLFIFCLHPKSSPSALRMPETWKVVQDDEWLHKKRKSNYRWWQLTHFWKFHPEITLGIFFPIWRAQHFFSNGLVKNHQPKSKSKDALSELFPLTSFFRSWPGDGSFVVFPVTFSENFRGFI